MEHLCCSTDDLVPTSSYWRRSFAIPVTRRYRGLANCPGSQRHVCSARMDCVLKIHQVDHTLRTLSCRSVPVARLGIVRLVSWRHQVLCSRHLERGMFRPINSTFA